MNFAIFILMLTAIPVMYYYYTMYEVNEKTRYLIGLLAGVWAFVGILLIRAGVIGFSYFIIFIIIIALVYVFEKIMVYVDENFEEADQEEYEIEWPVEVSNVAMAVIVFLCIILLYFSFFIIPVEPAQVDDPSGFNEDGEVFAGFPNAYKYEYTSTGGSSKVVVITIRSIPLTTGFLDSALKKAKPEIEDYIKEKYGQNAKLELVDEGETEVNDHNAVEQEYDVNSGTFGTKVADMVLQAFFCHETFQTVVIGYTYPPGGKTATLGLVGDISC